MGRMYQAMGEYEKALEYTRRQEEILEAEEEKNYSGLAYDYYDE